MGYIRRAVCAAEERAGRDVYGHPPQIGRGKSLIIWPALPDGGADTLLPQMDLVVYCMQGSKSTYKFLTPASRPDEAGGRSL
jgi:hypothetical protein